MGAQDIGPMRCNMKEETIAKTVGFFFLNNVVLSDQRFCSSLCNIPWCSIISFISNVQFISFICFEKQTERKREINREDLTDRKKAREIDKE